MDLRTGTCPLCHTNAVYMMDPKWANTIALGAWSKINLNRYMCTHCGYTQEFLDDQRDLERVTQKWHPVPPSTKIH